MAPDKSSLGECIASWLADGEHLLVALESYFDGSNVGGWENGSLVTLAGFAADDDIWIEFDKGWKAILMDDRYRPSVDHIHMRKAAHLLPPFDFKHGWNLDRVAILVTDLLKFLQTMDKKRFHQFGCTVDLDAYRKLQAEGIVADSPTEMCVMYCPFMVLSWFLVEYPGVIHSAHYFFDENEPFKSPFEEKWKREKSSPISMGGKDYCWSLIKTVTTASMTDKPALQAADLLAWSTNRSYASKMHGKQLAFHHIEPIMKQIIPSHWIVCDEARLRQLCSDGKLRIY